MNAWQSHALSAEAVFLTDGEWEIDGVGALVDEFATDGFPGQSICAQ